ncbi:MAG: hypothetical protein ACQGQO_10960 [Sphaerochaetaceae bacterium]
MGKAMKTSRIISGCAEAVQKLQDAYIRQKLSRSCRMRTSGRSCPGVAGCVGVAGRRFDDIIYGFKEISISGIRRRKINQN